MLKIFQRSIDKKKFQYQYANTTTLQICNIHIVFLEQTMSFKFWIKPRSHNMKDIQRFENSVYDKTEALSARKCICSILFCLHLRLVRQRQAFLRERELSFYCLFFPCVLEGNCVLMDIVYLCQPQHAASRISKWDPNAELLSMYSCANSSSNT